jgi:hypothetical protein
LTFWSEKRLPLGLLKPFGYSAGRTSLHIACFCNWLTLDIALHIWKYVSSKKLHQAQDLAEEENAHRSMVKSMTKSMQKQRRPDSAKAFADDKTAPVHLPATTKKLLKCDKL